MVRCWCCEGSVKCGILSAPVHSKCGLVRCGAVSCACAIALAHSLKVRETPASSNSAVRFAVEWFGVLRFAKVCCGMLTSGTRAIKVWKRCGLGTVTVRYCTVGYSALAFY